MRAQLSRLVALTFVLTIVAPSLVLAANCDDCASIEDDQAWSDCYDMNCVDNSSCCHEACNCGTGGLGRAFIKSWSTSGDADAPPFTIDFDLAIPEAIGLTATWTASGTSGVVETCDASGNCVQSAYEPRALVRMADDTGGWAAFFYMGASDFPSGDRSLVPLMGPGASWDPLRDGVVEIHVGPILPTAGPGETVSVITPATMQVESVWTARFMDPVPLSGQSWGTIKASFR